MNYWKIGRAMFAFLSVAALAAGCSGRVAAPDSLQTYQAKDQSFAIDYPSNWEVTGGGQSGYYSARFTSGSASIKVTADMVGSVIGDIAESQSGMLGIGEAGSEGLEELEPVHQVHEMGKEKMAEEWANYQESAPATVQTAFGEGRLAEFIGNGSFGAEVRGWRLTALGVDRRITVVCAARESDWQSLKPSFEKVIASLKHGR